MKKKKKMVKNQRGHLSQCRNKESGGGTSEMDYIFIFHDGPKVSCSKARSFYFYENIVKFYMASSRNFHYSYYRWPIGKMILKKKLHTRGKKFRVCNQNYER